MFNDQHQTSRRELLIAGGAALGLLATGCGASQTATSRPISPDSAAVRAAEAKRHRPGAAMHQLLLAAAPLDLDLAGRQVRTWAYGAEVPGPEIRVRAGDTIRATLTNGLPVETTTHWHGIAIRNDMDGVPNVTQRAIQAGGQHLYDFIAPDPGTYFFHTHVGVQLDHGLYGPLIVEDPHEPLTYDQELVLVLDDWTDGLGPSPDMIYQRLAHHGGAMGGMQGMSAGTSSLLGGDAGDVSYPLYLINGRPSQDPFGFSAKPGQRVRLRVINTASDTAFRIALGDHQMIVTHTDGYPVVHRQTDAVLLTMGERFDALVTLQSGVFPLVAMAEGKGASAMAVVRTALGQPPSPSTVPTELTGPVLRLIDLRADPAVRLPDRAPDRTATVRLEGSMDRYRWTIDGHAYNPEAQGKAAPTPIDVRQGERVRIAFENQTMMYHPMHLHGHTFQVGGEQGPRKDTAIVLPMTRVLIDLEADNPGQWFLHCHNTYHMEAGMATLLSYRT